MAEPYNLTTILGTKSLDKLMVASNSFVDDTFGVFILLAIWIIIFIRLKNYDMKVASFASSFITTLCSLMLMLIGMASFKVFLVCVVITALTALFNKFEE